MIMQVFGFCFIRTNSRQCVDMLCLFMLYKTVLPVELLVALITPVRFNTCVNGKMRFKVRRRHEALATVMTTVRVDAVMPVLVPPQVVPGRAQLVAC